MSKNRENVKFQTLKYSRSTQPFIFLRSIKEYQEVPGTYWLNEICLLVVAMHTAQILSFPVMISSVNVTKFAVSCGFGHIYGKNP